MEKILQIFIIIPFIGFILSLITPRMKENLISRTAFGFVGLNLLCISIFVIYWIYSGHPNLNLNEILVYQTTGYEFLLDFYFDKISMVYLLVGSFLTFLVTIYSRYYLHRERGYKRFFNTVLFFYLGYNITVLSGNFETLFLGWEILGISSFLLISFYRERYLPVKNAIKVFSIYRIGDVGLLLVMWLSHHLWHENVSFMKLNNYELVHEHLQYHSVIGVFISSMILLSAAAKSAQFPFSSWLPRAMEGPTPSSAIFYGSLSVHIGVFLLLRTFPFWDYQYSVRVLIAFVGLITAILGGLTARVQSSVKSQIAYASLAQIGIIFIEVAAGFENLALIHFAGNAFLRTYQLLVSPSVVSYLIKEQFYNFTPRKHSAENSLPNRLKYTIYLFSLKEWNLDWFMSEYIWMPIKRAGRKMSFMNFNTISIVFAILFFSGLIAFQMEKSIPEIFHRFLSEFYALFGLILVLKSFTERENVWHSFTLIIMNNFMVAMAISFNEHFEFAHTVLYLSGIVFAGFVGYFSLNLLKKREQQIDLTQFYGHSYKHPRLAFLFLLVCMALSGFPITPTFIGEDLIYSHIGENQAVLALIVSLSFIIDGLALIRIYSRLFLGAPIKRFHEVGFRSS